MGFSEIVSQVLLVFLFIVIFSSIFLIYRSSVKSLSSDVQTVYEDLNRKVHTDIKILNEVNSSIYHTLTLVNTGSITLDLKYLDVFVNSERISRDDLSFELFNQTIDALLWNPTEALNISFSKSLSGQVLFQVTTDGGISAYYQRVVS